MPPITTTCNQCHTTFMLQFTDWGDTAEDKFDPHNVKYWANKPMPPPEQLGTIIVEKGYYGAINDVLIVCPHCGHQESLSMTG